jgi:hypothetical protein
METPDNPTAQEGLPSVLDLNFANMMARPNFSNVLERMLLLDCPVFLHSRTDLMSLIQATRRYAFKDKDGKTVKGALKLHTRTIGHEKFIAKVTLPGEGDGDEDGGNPLGNYARRYKTTYGLWKDLSTRLRRGETVAVMQRRDAYRVINSLRHYFPETRGHGVITTAVGDEFHLHIPADTLKLIGKEGANAPEPAQKRPAASTRRGAAKKAAKKAVKKAAKKRSAAKKAAKKAARKRAARK